MSGIAVRVRVLEREAQASIADEGRVLQSQVEEALARGPRPGAAAVVVRPARTELLDLRSAAQHMPVMRFLAGLSRSRPSGQPLPHAIGLMGRFHLRPSGQRGEAPVPVALAFLEAADCRWWLWQVLLDAEGRPLEDTATVRSAEAGDALPAGLGRWWSLGRRAQVSVRYEPRTPAEMPVPTSPHVH